MSKPLNNRVYTKFNRHVDNANETVSAASINNVQDVVSNTELNVANIHDSQYMDRVLFTFDNNLFVNSLFANETNDKTYIDFSSSKNLVFDENQRTLSVNSLNLSAEIYTVKITSTFGDNVPLNDFYLITDEFIPVGASIKYYLINQKGESFPITQNSTQKPLHLYSELTNVTVKAVMTKNAIGESPNLYGSCLMFFDTAVEGNYGLTNPDLRRFNEIQTGLTVLVRDRANDDRVVQIKEADGVTNLNFDDKGTLISVVKDNISTNQTSTDTLNYGDYLDSGNVTETVLLSILSTVVTTDAINNDINYTFTN